MGRSVSVLKDEEHEHPVPTEWRPKFTEIVAALKAENFSLHGIENVAELDDDTAAGIARNISDYNCTLAALPHESWDTSVCQWQLKYWEVLVDLFTDEEGRSDLVLHAEVFETDGGFAFNVHFVYVP